MKTRCIVFLLSLSFWAHCVAETSRTSEGFALPEPGKVFEFPRDHGSHPQFKIEWWYVTGHLTGADGGRFGFQATFFRYANTGGFDLGASPAFGKGHWFLAHMALVDLGTGKFLYQERLNREGWDAAASTETLDTKNGPWSLGMDDSGTLRLRGGVRAEASFDLTLVPEKPWVAFGKDGVSRKGSDREAASYYLSCPRLRAQGTLSLDGVSTTVTGQSWMDHEISSSQLSKEQTGWDWASVQLNDGREIMLYRMRLANGTADPASNLTWILKDGTLKPGSFKWEVLSTWKSPKTGAEYPARIRLGCQDPVLGAEFTLVIEPLVSDQELQGRIGGVTYWEGACRVVDSTGREVGLAYLELTGYGGKLKF